MRHTLWIAALGALPLMSLLACDGPGAGTASGPWPVDAGDVGKGDPDGLSGHDGAVGDASDQDTSVQADTTTPPPDSAGPPDAVTPPLEGPVDPACLDGQYTETLPAASASLDDVVAGYGQANYMAFIEDALTTRYPLGWHLVQGGLQNQAWGHCVDLFLGQKATADQVIGQLSTIVHECGHFFDIAQGGFDGAAYIITDAVKYTCSGGSSQAGGLMFARSRLLDDAYADLHPPCPPGGFSGCDGYANVYLDGDPDDGTFDSGDQGFDMLLEETVQYVNSLATGYAFHDRLANTVSERDGILTFLWYLERYLRMARLEVPAAYQQLVGSACWRDVVLTVWGRAWLFLAATEDLPKLGIQDDKLMTLVLDPELLGEIQRVRDAAGCD